MLKGPSDHATHINPVLSPIKLRVRAIYQLDTLDHSRISSDKQTQAGKDIKATAQQQFALPLLPLLSHPRWPQPSPNP